MSTPDEDRAVNYAGAPVIVDPELRKTIYHEVGHALADAYFGGTPGPISVESTLAWEGVCWYAQPADRDVPADELARCRTSGLPAVEWPAAVRRSLDVQAIVAAAGIAAEQLQSALPPDQGGPARRTEIEPALAVLRDALSEPLAPLEPAERRLLELGDDPDYHVESDLEIIYRLGLVLYRDDHAAADSYTRLAIVQARQILEHEELARRSLSRLADALAAHGELSVAAVAAILTRRRDTMAPPGAEVVAIANGRARGVRVAGRDYLIVPGLRLPGDDAIVRAHPDAFEAAPPRDGTMICIAPFITGNPPRLVRLGDKLAADDELVQRFPRAFQPGPIDPRHLLGLRESASFGSDRAHAVRERGAGG